MDKIMNGETVEMSAQEEADFLATQGPTDAEEVVRLKKKLTQKEKDKYIDAAISVKAAEIEAMTLEQLKTEDSQGDNEQ